MHHIIYSSGVLFFLIFVVSRAYAVLPDEILNDPQLELRAREISSHLRCLVCQNESIDDSNAPLARDLRLLVRERLTAGDNNSQVIDFIVARYGEFILLKPRFNRETYILWFAPFVLVVLAAIGCVWWMMRRKNNKLMPLTGEEKKRLKKILNS